MFKDNDCESHQCHKNSCKCWDANAEENWGKSRHTTYLNGQVCYEEQRCEEEQGIAQQVSKGCEAELTTTYQTDVALGGPKICQWVCVPKLEHEDEE